MKCTSCGFDDGNNSAFCPNCGNSTATQSSPQQPQYPQEPPQQYPQQPPQQYPQQPPQQYPQQPPQQYSQQYVPPQNTAYTPFPDPAALNPVAEHTLQILKDGLFLVVCIAMSVSSGILLINKSFPLIDILCTIFLWIVFSQSQKGIVDAKYLRFISGTVYATYIIQWILYLLVAFLGVLCTFLFAAFSSNDMWNKILSQMELYTDDYSWVFNSFSSTISSFAVIIGVILIFAAIVGILFNIFGTGSIHKFVQSLYRSVFQGQLVLVKCDAAKTWLMVFGILSGLSAVSGLSGGNMASFLSSGCKSTALIISSILVGKFFARLQQAPPSI